MAPRQPPLVWTAPALDDLDDFAAWIAVENPTAAGELVQRALEAVERLRRFPASGRWVPELAASRIYREVIVSPLRIIYRRETPPATGAVLIVHVMRGEQQLRPRSLRRGRPTSSHGSGQKFPTHPTHFASFLSADDDCHWSGSSLHQNDSSRPTFRPTWSETRWTGWKRSATAQLTFLVAAPAMVAPYLTLLVFSAPSYNERWRSRWS